MKMPSPKKGIMYVIRTLKERAAPAANETNAWHVMQNTMGMMVCPVPQQNLNRQFLGRQR